MRATWLHALTIAGIAPAGALAIGAADEVTVLAGNRVSTTRGAFVAEDGGTEPAVVVLRGAEVGGAIPDASSVQRERRPFLPPVRADTDAHETPVRVQIVLPSGSTYATLLPSRHGRIHVKGSHTGRPKHYKHRKSHKRYEKKRGRLVAAARPLWVSPTFGAPHSTRSRLVHQRGGHASRHGSGKKAGRVH